jgi:hypothetical protein
MGRLTRSRCGRRFCRIRLLGFLIRASCRLRLLLVLGFRLRGESCISISDYLFFYVGSEVDFKIGVLIGLVWSFRFDHFYKSTSIAGTCSTRTNLLCLCLA